MQAGMRTLILDQQFDSGTLYALRAAVQAHTGQVGLSDDRASDVVLAVHELAANAVAHGAGRGRLRMWDLFDTLSCEVVDGGPGQGHRPATDAGPGRARFPAAEVGPGQAGFPAADAGPAEAGGSWPVIDPWPARDGHGLWLVRQVADHLDLRSGPRGTRAIIGFALPRRADH